MILIASSLVCLGAGCESARVKQSLTTGLDAGGGDDSAQMNFLHDLAVKDLASNDEALAALLLFAPADRTSPSSATQPATAPSSYGARVAELKRRRLLPPEFDAPADEAVRRGTVAYALCRALEIRGGVTMRLFGLSPRYAVRELVDLGIFPMSSPDQTFSGTELVGVIGKAEDYQRGGGGEKTPGGLADDPK
jgi:hypothetical protein